MSGAEKDFFSAMPYWKKLLLLLGSSFLVFLVLVIVNPKRKNQEFDYKCKDKAKAILSWRDQCNSSSLLAWAPFNPPEIYKKWCECVEQKFDAQRLASEDCRVSGATVEGVYNLDEVKVSCGTPAEPK